MSEYIVETFGSTNGGTYDERREKIVRCRDCRYLIEPTWLGEKQTFCSYMGDMSVEYDGFCKWGEHK